MLLGAELIMNCAVIFDWDGTLADSKQAVVASFQKVFQENSVHVSDEFIVKRIGIGSRNLLIDALKASGVSFDERILQSLLKRKIEVEIGLSSMVKLFDGAVDVLKSVQDLRTALASMNNRAVVEELLDRMHVRECFDVVVAAEDVKRAKPDPEIFLEAAKRLHCPPSECVVLEDSIFGVKAARLAGMKCAAVSSGSYSRGQLEAEKPDLVIDSLRNTLEIVDFLRGQNSRA